MTIELTKSQCVSLVDFIDCGFIQFLRDDDSLDNLDYVINICDAYKKFKEAAEESD